MQGSVWITPDPLTEIQPIQDAGDVNVDTLTFFEGRPCAKERDEDIVASAWNFREINVRYVVYREILSQRPTKPLTNLANVRAFQCWMKMEREAWLDAITLDPLLPKALLPAEYRGMEAWHYKQEVMAKAAKQVRGFEL